MRIGLDQTKFKGKKLSNKQKKELIEFFDKNENYAYHLTNLWQTRAGLYKIIETREDLKDKVKDQFHTINNLIGILLD